MCTNHSDDFDPFEGLDDDLEGAATVAPKEKTRYACEHCGGSGKWSRGFNSRGESKCFACNGKGYFATSRAARSKARAARQNRKVKRQQAIEAEAVKFAEENAELVRALVDLSGWNSFAQELLAKLAKYGSLTPGQIAAAERMIKKVAENRAKRAAERKADEITVDLSAIRAMFDRAIESGLKRPTYRAEGLIISRAPDHGRNAGSLYVKAGGEYQGKIDPENVYRPAYAAAKETKTALETIAANPAEAAVRYGRETGSCSCCGRTLTDPNSIEAGIGPICAGKYGF